MHGPATNTQKYFSNFKTTLMRKESVDPELGAWLWDHSEQVTGIRLPFDKWKSNDYNTNVRRNREAVFNRSGLFKCF